VLWIDPIDASSAFEQDLKHITTMIGISIKGRPKAGVIHVPFHSEEFGRTFVGTPESGLFRYDIESST
jgi:3'(2'), 5'-bisphosphate nucleotidase